MPLNAAAPAAEAAPATGAPRPAVLAVDDLPEKRLVIETLLAGIDAEIVFAASGRDALREILRREFAVVLLDVNMPDIDGFETATLIRGYKQSASTPIIFLTAYADEMQSLHGYTLGAVDYIVAPVLPEVLRSKVGVFLELWSAQQRLRQQAEERVALVAAQAARDAAQANARRLEFLAAVGRRLDAGLDDGAAVDAVLGFVQAELGGVVRLLRDGDAGTAAAPLGALAAAAPDGARVELGGDALEALQGLRGTAEDGRDANPLVAGCMLPLRAGARRLGTLVVAVHERTPMWDAVEGVAQRLALALENARLLRELRQEVEVRRCAEERMAAASRRKDEFLAMLSHELRNPLAPIRAAAEVVRIAGGQHPKLEWASAVTIRQVEQLRRLIDELLDVARINQGKVALRLETLDLRTVVQQAVETVKPLLDERRHALALQLPEQRVWLRGDAARLAQVVANLLTNAAKYTDDGGRIELALAVDDGQAQIRVRDNGIGIDAELLPRIFDLFEQGERSLDRSQGGLGVGLSLAQRLVAMHHGTIAARSDGRGRGAEFEVRLPCVADVSDAAAAAPDDAHAARPCRVLVVDDNRDAAESVAMLLALEGHEVHTAADGTEALGIAALRAPEVVLLDIGLPGIDGYAVAERLRAMPGTRDAMLIALTGYGNERDRERSRAAGFDLHLVKPADPRTIAQAIDEHRRDAAAAPQDGAARPVAAPPGP